MTQRHDSILATIGDTPIVRLNRLAPRGVNIFVKIESFNPMGSVKDRLALGVIEAAERSGDLKPGQAVVEATSGNTGIGLAMVCAVKGHPLIITMAESFSVERRRLMRFLGAKVVLTPASEKGTGMVRKAREIAEAIGGFLPSQFENEANADVHAATTAPEILAAFKDDPLHCWVTGAGTGGTLKGVARILRDLSPATRIVVCEPDNSALLASGWRQPRNADGSPTVSHPGFRPHVMQGWTPDFIPKLAEDALDGGLVDEIVSVDGARAMSLARELATREGIFAGISSGATLTAAIDIASRSPAGTNILAMLPDTGERYLSTPLFADIAEGMDEEESALSHLTPSCRFDVAATAASNRVPETRQATDPEAVTFVEHAIGDPTRPVTLFALKWCEFCWSVRKLFDALGIDYRSVDLDDPELQARDFSTRLRTALAARVGSPTIPQVFIGGEYVGGAAETLTAFDEGRLKALLERSGVAHDARFAGDARAFLPGWLQRRG